jgi:hypothetical protein
MSTVSAINMFQHLYHKTNNLIQVERVHHHLKKLLSVKWWNIFNKIENVEKVKQGKPQTPPHP